METPVHYCARAGNSDILLEIVKHIEPGKVQIAVNKQAKNGWSPLLIASSQGHLEIVKILLQMHARVDVFDEVGIEFLCISRLCFRLNETSVGIESFCKSSWSQVSKCHNALAHQAIQDNTEGFDPLFLKWPVNPLTILNSLWLNTKFNLRIHRFINRLGTLIHSLRLVQME